MDYTSIRRGDVLVDEPYVYRVLAVSPEGRARLLRVNGAVEVVDLTKEEAWEHLPGVPTAGWVALCECSRAAQAVGAFLDANHPKSPMGHIMSVMSFLSLGLVLRLILFCGMLWRLAWMIMRVLCVSPVRGLRLDGLCIRRR